MIDLGAEVFLTAAAWPAARVEPWLLLNRARAMENQAFVFACNGAGTERRGSSSAVTACSWTRSARSSPRPATARSSCRLMPSWDLGGRCT